MKVVFDTEGILKYFLGEGGAEEVKSYFEKCMEGELEGLVNFVNLTEFYYILGRKNEELAEDKLTNLKGFGVKEVGAEDEGIWKKAAKIKTSKAIPLGDCFAAATALAFDGKLLTGMDEHFRGLDLDLIPIEKSDKK